MELHLVIVLFEIWCKIVFQDHHELVSSFRRRRQEQLDDKRRTEFAKLEEEVAALLFFRFRTLCLLEEEMRGKTANRRLKNQQEKYTYAKRKVDEMNREIQRLEKSISVTKNKIHIEEQVKIPASCTSFFQMVSFRNPCKQQQI